MYLPISQQVVPGGCWKLLRDMQLLWSIADCLSHPQFNKRIHTQKQSSQYVDFNIVRLFSFLSMRALSVFSLHQAFSGFITTQKVSECVCRQVGVIHAIYTQLQQSAGHQSNNKDVFGAEPFLQPLSITISDNEQPLTKPDKKKNTNLSLMTHFYICVTGVKDVKLTINKKNLGKMCPDVINQVRSIF